MKILLGKIKGFFGLLWKGIGTCRKIIGNLIFLFIIVFVLSALFFKQDNKVPDGAALIVAPEGNIVEQKSYSDPAAEIINQMLGDTVKRETLLKDILDAVDSAKDDKRIKAILLDLDRMEQAGICKLHDIGVSLKSFKESGKKVIAFGDSYSQQQYYLASYADEVYIHPFGTVSLNGYGIYRLYFKEAIEKLMLKYHVFTAGIYKSALEPYIRNDMSKEAKEVNTALLKVLWESYKNDVETMRGLPKDAIDDYINHMNENLKEVEGDCARLVLEHHLVDGLKTRDQIRSYLIGLVGKNKKKIDFNSIGFNKYLGIIRPSHSLKKLKNKKVAVLVAKGTILDGKHHPGNIGSDSFSELIRQARDDEKIKAVVLRIDSPGGGVFASEVIRRELELLQDTGKPVVVSMGSVAASGGYWIAANADEIWASPTTITGSIGVMVAFPTFEETLNHLGVNNDGVGTTKMSSAFDLSRPINPFFADSLNQTTQYTYKRFVRLVAEGRNMAVEAVEKIAQGRVWSGKTALQLGLVDQLGGVKDAIKSAAKKAGLDEYEVVYVERSLNVKELLLKRLDSQIKTVLEAFFVQQTHPVDGLVNILSRAVEEISLMNDPRGIYSQCFTCDIQ